MATHLWLWLDTVCALYLFGARSQREKDDDVPSFMDLVGYGHRLEQEIHFSFAEVVTAYQVCFHIHK
jgi:hypothetical protein